MRAAYDVGRQALTSMFNVLIDTSVWLDLAQDPKQTSLIDPLDTMLSQRHMTLLVPRIVLTEFHKNRQRVAECAISQLRPTRFTELGTTL